MVFSTRGRRNDDAMKYFCPDNKKKNGCLEVRPLTILWGQVQRCLIKAP